MALYPLLLAAVDWVEIVVIVFIMTSSLIGQLFKSNQKRRKKAKRNPARPQPKVPPAGRRPAQAGAGPAPPRKDSLEKEIEAFLRKSLGGKTPAEQAASAAPPAAKRSAQQRGAAPSRQPPPQPPPRRPAPAFRPHESVSEHVQRHIRQKGGGRRESHLGEQIGQADERLESHLTEVFEHTLGSLGRRDTGPHAGIRQGTDAAIWDGARESSPLSEELFRMLSSPQEVQVAIVLSEILRRPEDRWR